MVAVKYNRNPSLNRGIVSSPEAVNANSDAV